MLVLVFVAERPADERADVESPVIGDAVRGSLYDYCAGTGSGGRGVGMGIGE